MEKKEIEKYIAHVAAGKPVFLSHKGCDVVFNKITYSEDNDQCFIDLKITDHEQTMKTKED